MIINQSIDFTQKYPFTEIHSLPDRTALLDKKSSCVTRGTEASCSCKYLNEGFFQHLFQIIRVFNCWSFIIVLEWKGSTKCWHVQNKRKYSQLDKIKENNQTFHLCTSIYFQDNCLSYGQHNRVIMYVCGQ